MRQLMSRRPWRVAATGITSTVLLGAGVLSGVPAAADTLAVSFTTSWGSHGTADGQFVDVPTAVAVAPDGSVYVGDYGTRVQHFTAAGTYLGQWAGGAAGIGVGPDGSVYVTGGDQVHKFTADGQPVTAWGGNGTGAGQFNGVSGVAVAADGSVYVTDNKRVQKFTASGAYLTEWGSHDPVAPYSVPIRVAVGPDGSVYVVEYNNNRVQKFTPDGVFLAQWGSAGSGPGQFDGPNGITVSATGLVYVSEYARSRVQAFTSQGTYLAEWGGSGAGAGQFYGISDVAAGPQGAVYAVDYGNYRIEKFTARLSQAVTFTTAPPSNATPGGASYQVGATGGASGNPVVLSIDPAAAAVCRISGSTVTFVGAGTCTVKANQAGNDNYAPASEARQSFPVLAVPPTTTPSRTATILSLDATPEPAHRGATLRAKAKLRTAAGPLANRVVKFYFRVSGATAWTYRAKATTNSRGLAVRQFTARRTGVWKARFTGSTRYLPDQATDRVKVIR